MFAITLWCLLLCLGSNTVWTQEDESFFSTFEEGKSYWLRCYSNSINTMGWQMKINNEYVDISTCDFQGNCKDNMAPNYVSNFNTTGNIYYGNQKYTMWVHIRSADKDENTFRCFIGSDPKPDRIVEVFARPSNPVCNLPVLVTSDTLSITCRTDKVYPGALLEAKLHQQNHTDGPEADVQCETSPSLTDPGYNTTQCTGFFSLSGLEPGDFEIEAAMYPNISNLDLALRKKVESDQIDPIKLTAPGVRLSSDCPMDTYIVSDECKCELTTDDYSPGQARWYTQDGDMVGTENSDDRSSTLTLSYDHTVTDFSPTYECRAVTVLNVSSPLKVLYFTKFAYGPYSVSIETSDDGRSDLPSAEEHVTNVTCRVSAGNVQPSVRITIIVNNEAVVNHQEAMIIDNHYVEVYSFSRSREGFYFITCKAENTMSSELSVSNSTTCGTRKTNGDGPNLIHLIVLPAAAAFLIIVLFVVIITVCIRRRNRTSSPPEKDNTVNSTVTSDPQVDEYITPVSPDTDDYDKIIVNDDPTFDGGVSCINPTFDETHQYDRLSEVITSMTLDNSWTSPQYS